MNRKIIVTYKGLLSNFNLSLKPSFFCSRRFPINFNFSCPKLESLHNCTFVFDSKIPSFWRLLSSHCLNIRLDLFIMRTPGTHSLVAWQHKTTLLSVDNIKWCVLLAVINNNISLIDDVNPLLRSVPYMTRSAKTFFKKGSSKKFLMSVATMSR